MLRVSIQSESKHLLGENFFRLVREVSNLKFLLILGIITLLEFYEMPPSYRRVSLLLLLWSAASAMAFGQWTNVPLNDLSAFKPTQLNWSVAGKVSANPFQKHNLEASTGTGILVNKNNEAYKAPLITAFEHGDIDIELEVMMPAQSNSGLYFMGRYEIQLLDSWGAMKPAFSDIGGIYQRWDNSKPENERGYEGKAPRQNAGRAPGIWQKFEISFSAPVFDKSGKKIKNATFNKVVLNNTVIHEHVAVSGPTRGAMFDDEKPFGPLMIQGDHGPVAFRNIRYRNFNSLPVLLENLSFNVYRGNLDKWGSWANRKVDASGKATLLDDRLAGANDDYAILFKGTIKVPEDRNYKFTTRYEGSAQLLIDGKPIIDSIKARRYWTKREGSMFLSTGNHSIEVQLHKKEPKQKPALDIYVEAENLRPQRLSDPKAALPESPTPPYIKAPEGEAEVFRGFAMHNGKTLPYAGAIGFQKGYHAMVNLNNASLLKLWKGNFVDVVGMWHSRGSNQVMYPASGALEFADVPSVSPMANKDAAWPDTTGADSFKFKGYKFKKGMPIIDYQVFGYQVSDQFSPLEKSLGLLRNLTVQTDGSKAAVLLARAKSITSIGQGVYLLDGPGCYVHFTDSNTQKAMLRSTANGMELIVPLAEKVTTPQLVQYRIEW